MPQGTTRVTPSQAGVVNGGPVASSSNQANHSTSASTPLSLFLHLDAPPAHHNLRGGATAAGPHGVVHPAVVRLAQMYAEFKVVGANARCIAMLEAFKEVSRLCCPLGEVDPDVWTGDTLVHAAGQHFVVSTPSDAPIAADLVPRQSPTALHQYG